MKNPIRYVARRVRNYINRNRESKYLSDCKMVYDEISKKPQKTNPIENKITVKSGIVYSKNWDSASQLISEFNDVTSRHVIDGEYQGWAPDDAIWDIETQQHELWSFAPLAKYLSELKPHAKILELGCGPGHLFTLMSRLGIDGYIGIDGHPQFIQLNPLLHGHESNFKVLDLQKPIELGVDVKFDLIVSLEVLEHINERFIGNFIETIIRHSDKNTVIICTASTLDSYDVHVTVKPREWWLSKFAKYQLFEKADSEVIIKNISDRHPFNWQASNTNIFVLKKAV